MTHSSRFFRDNAVYISFLVIDSFEDFRFSSCARALIDILACAPHANAEIMQ
jgi:hypothetical protein